MKTETLKHFYKDRLIEAGVAQERAEQAAQILTSEQLHLISEIWPEWAATFTPAQDKISGSPT